MDNSPYAPPESDVLSNNRVLELTFASLNIWRKVYLGLNWFIVIIISLLFMVSLFDGAAKSGDEVFLFIITAIVAGFTYWTHWAVVERQVGHITAISIINLILGGNLISFLIMLSIRSISVKEREQYIIEDQNSRIEPTF
ncbi:MAG: hypothetical protein OEY19_11555 [Gammaproteobacteria bacterium]|nr:hypothetical protein [Gammaproteobacteria bacterium]MDH5629695.1 hypothetical protein [Gammaproteobacteria bacterium]